MVPGSSFWAASLPRIQIGFHCMHFTIEMFFEKLYTHIGWNAIKAACRHNINTLFTCQIIIFELHAFHEFRFTAYINVMCAGINATCQLKMCKFVMRLLTDSVQHA